VGDKAALPHSNPIEIASPKKRDEEIFLFAMGCETANVHVGSRRQIPAVEKDLKERGPNWLKPRKIEKMLLRDWRDWVRS